MSGERPRHAAKTPAGVPEWPEQATRRARHLGAGNYPWGGLPTTVVSWNIASTTSRGVNSCGWAPTSPCCRRQTNRHLK